MTALRFLLLEDSPLDVEVIQVTLIEGGIDCDVQRVETRADFVTALETHEFDLILADYALPGFDGISALEIARQLCPDTPFIIVSASLGEELAIDTLKQGATDYVLKQRLERLVPAVNRALREAQERLERKRAEAALRQSEAQYRMLFESIDEGFCICEMLFDENNQPVDYRFLQVNLAFEKLTGLQQATGKTARELVPNLEPFWVEVYGKVVQTGEPMRFENQSIAMNHRWFDVNAFPIGKAQSHQFAILFTNTSERQQAEKQLRESRAFLTHITDVAPIILYVYDLCETRNVWSNNNLALVLGYTPDEVQAMGANVLSQLLHPEDAKRYPAHFERLRSLQPDEVAEFEYRMRHKDDSWHWLSSREMAYLQNDDGTVKQIVGAAHDITARKQADERLHLLYETTSELLATEQPLALMNNLFSKLSAQLDLHYYFNFLVEEQDNQRKLHLTHHSEIPKDVTTQIEWIEFGQDICGMAAQTQRQIVLDQTQIATNPNAQLAHLLGITAYACQPLMVRGRLLGTLSFASLTRTHFTPEEVDLLQSVCEQMAIALERSNLTRSIQQQAERLQEANRIKDEFLAVLSHELRSPLNPILGWTRLLQSGNLDETRQREALVTIERNAKLQTQLIEDLLDISRIMQGKLTLTAAPVSLTFIISAAVETVRLAAEAKQIQILLDLDTEVAPVSGDAARLQQVVWNLLINAVKFTPNSGQVRVELRQLHQLAQIRVIDTGKGIDSQFLPHVFEYFRQADSTTTRKFGGLGLGLAIVRQIVEMHGGTVKAESLGDNQGATFTVQLPTIQKTVPARSEPTPAEAGTQETPLSNLRILVVDDDDDTRELQAFLLEQRGARVTTAASGLEALQALDQFIPHVIVSDIGMADMDGYMLMQQIRSRPPSQGGQVPAIALTAYARDFDQQKARQAGFQTHITKPVEPEALVEAIATLLC
jgi:PAS domain S-box-containing protein